MHSQEAAMEGYSFDFSRGVAGQQPGQDWLRAPPGESSSMPRWEQDARLVARRHPRTHLLLITEVGKSAEDRAQEVSEEEAETKAEADAMADEEAQNQAEEDHAVMSRRAQSHRQRQMRSRRKGQKRQHKQGLVQTCRGGQR